LILVSYRIASFEARAFRQWVMNALCEYIRDDKNIREGEVLPSLTDNSVGPSVTPVNTGGFYAISKSVVNNFQEVY